MLNKKQQGMVSPLAHAAFKHNCRNREEVREFASQYVGSDGPMFEEFVDAICLNIETEHKTIIPSKKDTPAFSPFRSLLDQWDRYLESENVDKVLDDDNYSFFFQKSKEVFGAPEESRIIFARLKNPDEDSDKKWAEEASFVGIDLARQVKGEHIQRLFGKKDLSEIKIISREDAAKALKS